MNNNNNYDKGTAEKILCFRKRLQMIAGRGWIPRRLQMTAGRGWIPRRLQMAADRWWIQRRLQMAADKWGPRKDSDNSGWTLQI